MRNRKTWPKPFLSHCLEQWVNGFSYPCSNTPLCLSMTPELAVRAEVRHGQHEQSSPTVNWWSLYLPGRFASCSTLWCCANKANKVLQGNWITQGTPHCTYQRPGTGVQTCLCLENTSTLVKEIRGQCERIKILWVWSRSNFWSIP